MPEYLALNKPLILDMDIGVSENWKLFKQKYEVYVTATGIKEKAKKFKRLESLEFEEVEDKDDPEVL